MIASDHPLFVGRPGTIGDRAGNFAVQNAETLLVLGSRLNIRQISYNWPAFARCAFKIQVDVDAAELDKPTVRRRICRCIAICAFFSNEMNRQLDAESADCASSSNHGLRGARNAPQKYSVLDGKQSTAERLNPYHFVDALSEESCPLMTWSCAAMPRPALFALSTWRDSRKDNG